MASTNGTDSTTGAQPATPARKTAIVTGGASGIGLAMAKHFASQGYNVAVFDVAAAAPPALQEVVATASQSQRQRNGAVPGAAPEEAGGEERVVFRRCDVSSWREQAEAFRAVYEDFGRVDVVCANAGISERGAGAMATVEDDEPREPDLKIMDVNLAGVIFSVKLAIHYMNKNDPAGSSRGSIICTASNAGLYPFPVSPLYAAAKAGVIGLVRSTAPLLKTKNIQINALAPAVLVTNIAPSKELFKDMVITPMSTLVKGVAQLISDSSLSGEIAEIHGDNVTLRPPHEYVDEDTRKNLENFERLGYA